MSFTALTPLPTAPTRADTPDDFIAKADAFVAQLVIFGSQINTFMNEVAAVAGALGSSSPDPELAALAGVTSAADKVPYFTGSGAASVATLTAFARTILAGVDGPAVRTLLALASMALQDASAVNITGGSVAGITDLALADGGTGASSASAARTNLGVAIGTNVQAWDADLDAIAALATTTFGRSLLTQADAAATRTAIGVSTISAITGGASSGEMTIGPLTLAWRDHAVGGGGGSFGYGNSHAYTTWARAWIEGDDGGTDVSVSVISAGTSSASVRNSGGSASCTLFSIGV